MAVRAGARRDCRKACATSTPSPAAELDAAGDLSGSAIEWIVAGAVILRGFVGSSAAALAATVDSIAASAPFRHMSTPGGGHMSAAMTNCGEAGWVTDRNGYRYAACDPESGQRWPPMPPGFHRLAAAAAAAGGFGGFAPDVCLINRYLPGARLSLHRDEDERDFSAPIVSVSLGLPAVFLFGGDRRSDRPRRIPLEHGDVVVWGGPARLAYHGIVPLAAGEHPLTGPCRINLTFRRAL